MSTCYVAKCFSYRLRECLDSRNLQYNFICAFLYGIVAANVVHLNDCADLYNYGRKASGLFKISPPNMTDGDTSKWYRTFCEDGWTEIARRSQTFHDAVRIRRGCRKI